MIKAIETVYNGYRFRSRLEARWAVFFDTLGIPWEYEKEGYELKSGRYLPDFWLPQQLSFIEIKGQEPTKEEMQKAEELSLLTYQDVCIFYGEIEIPSLQKPYEKIIVFKTHFDKDYGVHSAHWKSGLGWAQCPWCLQFNIAFSSSLDEIGCFCYRYTEPFMFLNHPLSRLEKLCPELTAKEPSTIEKSGRQNLKIRDWWRDKCNKLLYAGDTPRLIAAYTAARQARFEHGEKG